MDKTAKPDEILQPDLFVFEFNTFGFFEYLPAIAVRFQMKLPADEACEAAADMGNFHDHLFALLARQTLRINDETAVSHMVQVFFAQLV